MSDLPIGLSYLKGVMEELNRLPSEEVNEDNAFVASVVHRALLNRVKGLNDVRSRERLRQDASDLTRWLESQPEKSAGAAYVQGYLAVAQSAGLSSAPSSFVTHSEIRFVPPDGFDDVEAQEGMRFSKGRVNIFISSLDRASFLRQRPSQPVDLGRLRAAFPNLPRFEDAEIVLGSVVGMKRRSISGNRVSIDYLLEVPGGYVRVSVQSLGDPVDEHEIESHLRTIAILRG
jgi:hypothetical protein